jgi:hypothetical protein
MEEKPMEHRPHHHTIIAASVHAALAAALAMLLLPVVASAGDGAGARQGVQARPGEIVLLRNVATRPADRTPASPGMALIVDPSPQGQLAAALGLGSGEMSDADFASLSATPRVNQGRGGTVDRAINGALGNLAGGNAHAGNTVAGNGVSSVVSGPMGAVGNATRGIGDRVTGALSQLPLSSVPAGGGH